MSTVGTRVELSRIVQARRALTLTATGRALLIAFAVAIGSLLLGATLDAGLGLPLAMRRLLVPLAVGAGATTFAWRLFGRALAALRASDETVALWFETRLPSLQYALVTSVDPHFSGQVPELERVVQQAPLEREVARAARGALWRPAATVLLAAMALMLVPEGTVARVLSPTDGDALARAGAASRATIDPLASIVVRVTPPAYAGLASRTYDDPTTVAALAGSRVSIEGLGGSVRGVLGVDTLAVRMAGNGWSIALPLPPRAAAVRLLGPVRERVLVFDPIADSIPAARLDEPSRDSVLRVAKGRIVLRAEVRDDHGLADVAFEYIVSSGAGESFTFRSGRVAARRFGTGERVANVEGSLSLDTLRLGPGDLIHLRAVASDRNDVTGPGVGASESRTLRIARADEYDSVSVDPMPPGEPEKNALSQRMILQMTQELRARERRMARGDVARDSRRVGVEQTRLRRRVGEIVFLRLGEDTGGEHSHFAGDGHDHGAEKPLDPDSILAAAERASNVDATRQLEGDGDETPVVAINRPLLEAYNHMWRASTELETANPGGAIPWMERAIEALERARAAERIYLRGRPPRVVVDLAKVRGTGKEQGTPAARSARVALDADRLARLARFDAALALIVRDPLAAADALLLLRFTLPADEPASAAAVDAAADAVRRGGDVTAALQRARRALAGAPLRRGGLSAWGQ